MDEEKLTDFEKKLFSELETQKSPPRGLEQKILTQLNQEGLIKKSTTMNVYLKWAASIAAAILIFFSGTFYGKTQSAQLTIEPTKGYMLILHEDTSFQPGDPMTMFEEYGRWMQETFERGVKITGQELKDESALVAANVPVSYRDGSDRKTTGYFILEASSYEEAIEVAQKNPHIKYGGSIEVKPYMNR